MARRRGIQGIGRVRKLLQALPSAVRAEIGRVLEKSGRKLAAAIAAAAPSRTGALRRGIGYRVNLKALRLRVGLVSVRKGRNSLFYGRIQDLGRKRQIVIVRRLLNGRRAELSARIAAGTARASRKPADLVTKPYPMRVPAMAGKRFVTGRYPDLRASLRENLKGIVGRATAGISLGGADD